MKLLKIMFNSIQPRTPLLALTIKTYLQQFCYDSIKSPIQHNLRPCFYTYLKCLLMFFFVILFFYKFIHKNALYMMISWWKYREKKPLYKNQLNSTTTTMTKQKKKKEIYNL